MRRCKISKLLAIPTRFAEFESLQVSSEQMTKVLTVSKKQLYPASKFVTLLAASAFLITSNSYFTRVAVSAAEPPAPAPSAAPGMSTATGPIDIKADTQEFAGDHVIANGHVHVNYKGTTVVAPTATLVRDAQGQPQVAVFTGHAYLVQDDNKIDADKLTFVMSDGKVIADGNAHSEVIASDGADQTPAGAAGKTDAKTAPAVAAKPAPAKPKGDWQTDDENGDAAPQVAMNADGTSGGAPAAAAAPAKPAEKIYTDSDHQIYEQNTGHFEAMGHVRVKHGDIRVTSNHLQLVYGADKKPETALFTGGVAATQNENNTKADAMTYFLTTQRLQASGNVRSKVIQQKTAGPGVPGAKKEKEKAASVTKPSASAEPMLKTNANKKRMAAEGNGTTFVMGMDTESAEPIYIFSDAQDYTKDNGRTTAEGNCTVYFNDSVGKGQRVVMLRNEEGRAERILFFGRSQVTQPGKRWIGDKITFMVPDQRVIAEGNTRAIILSTKGQIQPPAPGSATKAAAPATTAPAGTDDKTNSTNDSAEKLAKKKGADGSDASTGNDANSSQQMAATGTEGTH
jgi:lipopolysaccharide export system protein LptA